MECWDVHKNYLQGTGKQQEAELSDALRHVQRGQHLFKDGALHVGASQVGFLQVASRQVAVLHKPETLMEFGYR